MNKETPKSWAKSTLWVFYGDSAGVVHRLREWHIQYERIGSGVVINGIVLQTVRPECDVSGVE